MRRDILEPGSTAMMGKDMGMSVNNHIPSFCFRPQSLFPAKETGCGFLVIIYRDLTVSPQNYNLHEKE